MPLMEKGKPKHLGCPGFDLPFLNITFLDVVQKARF
jgi:hypothetical protein